MKRSRKERRERRTATPEARARAGDKHPVPGGASSSRRSVENPTGSSTRRAVRGIGYLCLVLLVVALYGRTAGFAFTRTDDKVLLTDDAVFIGNVWSLGKVFSRPFFPASSRGEAYYRPVVTASFILDAQRGGAAPLSFHVTNVALHAGCVCLLWLLLRRLGFDAWPAWFATAAFAAHPALTEAVVWIPGRCDLLLGIGVLASMLLFMRLSVAPRPVLLWGHLAAFAFALLSKEAGLVLPAVLVGWVILTGANREVLRNAKLWIGWLAVGGAWLVLRSGAIGTGGEGATERLSNLVSQLPVLVMQFGKLVLPMNLAVLASAKDTALLPGLVAVGCAGLMAVSLRRHTPPLYFWGLGFCALFILPGLPVSDFLIIENRLYVPAIGVLVAVLAVTQAALAAAPGPAVKWAAAAAASVVVSVLALMSWSYSESFREPHAFTEQAVRTSPHLGLAHLNRGIVLHLDNRMEDAEREYQAALSLDPTLAVTHNNLGLIHLNRGDAAGAETLFRQELEINPTYDKAFFNLGLALERLGRLPEAAASWKQAATLNPANDEARARAAPAEAGAPAGAVTPGAGAPVAVDQVSSDVLVRLYEDALRQQPRNLEIRKAFAQLCEQRRLPCAEEQRKALRDLSAATTIPPK